MYSHMANSDAEIPNAATWRAGERRVAEQAQRKHRLGDARLGGDERAQQDGGSAEGGEDRRARPTVLVALFSYEVMGLVGREGAGPPNLLRMARRGRMLDWAGESQYYVEPKRLASLGYLEARKERAEPARAPSSRTDKGLDALGAGPYARALQPRSRARPMLRLLVADLVGEAATRETWITLRDTSGTCSAALLDEIEAAAPAPAPPASSTC